MCKDKPVDFNVKKDAIPDAKVDEEAERKWLSEMERVEASIFEGKKLAKLAKGTNRDIAAEYFNKEDRRVGKNTTIMVDGFAVSKESMYCGDWEAVPTMAGKDPRLAERKRQKKPPIIPQEHCQVCIDGGELHCCQLCPRAYHAECLDRLRPRAGHSHVLNIVALIATKGLRTPVVCSIGADGASALTAKTAWISIRPPSSATLCKSTNSSVILTLNKPSTFNARAAPITLRRTPETPSSARISPRASDSTMRAGLANCLERQVRELEA
jgi:hypothetical protein